MLCCCVALVGRYAGTPRMRSRTKYRQQSTGHPDISRFNEGILFSECLKPRQYIKAASVPSLDTCLPCKICLNITIRGPIECFGSLFMSLVRQSLKYFILIIDSLITSKKTFAFSQKFSCHSKKTEEIN